MPSGGFSGRPFSLDLYTSESNVNSSANTSTVSWSLYMTQTGSYNSYNFSTSSWSVNIGGHTYSGTFTYDFRNYDQLYLGGNTTPAISHNANGTGSVSVSASCNAGDPVGSASCSGTQGLTDFVRPPSAPVSCTAALSGNSIIVTAGNATSPVTPVSYYVSYASSADAYATWSAESTMTSQSYTYSSLVKGRTYKFRTRAQSSEGYSTYTESATLFLPAGGKIKTDAGFVPTTTAKIKTDSGFVLLTTAKIKTDAGWINLS